VYIPAFAAKDLALAIDADPSIAAAPGRRDVDAATTRLVRAAWMLDGAADAGNREQIDDAYARLTAALAELEAALPHSPKP
jgi:hypothetical protein